MLLQKVVVVSSALWCAGHMTVGVVPGCWWCACVVGGYHNLCRCVAPVCGAAVLSVAGLGRHAGARAAVRLCGVVLPSVVVVALLVGHPPESPEDSVVWCEEWVQGSVVVLFPPSPPIGHRGPGRS